MEIEVLCVHRELIKTCNTQVLQVAWNICCHHAIQVMCATSECTMKSYCSNSTDGNTLTHCGQWWYVRILKDRMCSPESRVFTQSLDCGRTTKRVTNHSSCCYIHSALESMHKIIHLQQTFPISTTLSPIHWKRKWVWYIHTWNCWKSK